MRQWHRRYRITKQATLTGNPLKLIAAVMAFSLSPACSHDLKRLERAQEQALSSPAIAPAEHKGHRDRVRPGKKAHTAPAISSEERETMPAMDHSKMNHNPLPSTAQPRQPDTAENPEPDSSPGSADSEETGAGNHGNHHRHDDAGHGSLPRQEISPPSDVRDPHAYSEGYDFGPLPRPHMGDDDNQGSLLVDRLESQTKRNNTSVTYDWQAWYGPTYDRALIRAEGEIESGTFKNARNELLWAHAVTAYWDTHLGVRYDSGKGTDRGWLAFGVQGLAPYWLYVEATAYVNEQGRTAFRLETEYDLLLTQKLILQPRIELNIYSRRDDTRDVSSGLSDLEAGLRLRYEIVRELAPYVGFEWSGRFGSGADNIRVAGKDAEETRFVAGVRFWF
ncbi:Copper resistance protein B [Candidatus Methylobacter favarea]|uniref:Copper resistance protein B n=1 Tax=Candidatus Methylobacter favarea TaxID=2707345 RepID=A0A8S0YA64_9GAMM|nr:copper resistance protein B [Candidatus Methylobacter favarea]CAA9891181.1 Copper resistance protein B [Candidatus Methylobacter favarea]